MAGLPKDFNEDDFDDFNPHPYLGGYDIAETYGKPLPPSAAICHPVSFPVSLPPDSSSVGKVDSSSDSPLLKEKKEESESIPAPVVEPESEKNPVVPPMVEQPWFEPYAYGQSYQTELYKPDIFRSWPFSIPKHCCRHMREGEVRDFDYWNHMMRGLDFLFGHAQGYGERRVGTDVYGTPIYANKRTATESVAVQVEQTPVQRLEYHQSSTIQVHPDGLDRNMQWPSWCEERKEEKNEKYGNSYESNEYYNYEQSTSNWDLCSSYHDTYHNWRYNNLGYSSNVEGESMEENKLLRTPVSSYNMHHHKQPLHVPVEPTEQTWTQKMISYEKEEEPYQPDILSNAFELERYEKNQYEHPEPFKPSWSHNVRYYGEYLDGGTIRSANYSTSYGGEGNLHTAFAYNEESMYYEQNQSSWLIRDSRLVWRGCFK